MVPLPTKNSEVNDNSAATGTTRFGCGFARFRLFRRFTGAGDGSGGKCDRHQELLALPERYQASLFLLLFPTVALLLLVSPLVVLTFSDLTIGLKDKKNVLVVIE
ncbi:hypothetical protein PNOK_0597400 [Pyrrhoderma noxium]|uniref:Uncharacterized protein n=1 Tax=Pyrrhoderma noxium TaxID=2282107 RepID=A0A286UHL8_9AGAM|nr:hypothetical protein PNOK_0597400 [Pyrrhoderma noxium]